MQGWQNRCCSIRVSLAPSTWSVLLAAGWVVMVKVPVQTDICGHAKLHGTRDHGAG